MYVGVVSRYLHRYALFEKRLENYGSGSRLFKFYQFGYRCSLAAASYNNRRAEFKSRKSCFNAAHTELFFNSTNLIFFSSKLISSCLCSYPSPGSCYKRLSKSAEPVRKHICPRNAGTIHLPCCRYGPDRFHIQDRPRKSSRCHRDT